MASADEEASDRYVTRMGKLVADAERRVVLAEIERDFWQQRDRANQERITELESHIGDMHRSGQD